MEKTAYLLLFIVILFWLLGMIAAFPFGLIGLVGIVGIAKIGLLFIKTHKERQQSKENNYSKKINP